MLKIPLYSLFVLFVISFNANAQFNFSQELGVFIGPTAFQSDYGGNNSITSNVSQLGLGFGIVHYLNFSYNENCDCSTSYTYFNDHFKIKTELSYNKTDLKHFGNWVDPNKTSIGAIQLRAMRGTTTLTNLGLQLEFFPFSIRDFSYALGSFAPFISLGSQYSFYTTKATSTMGNLGTSVTTFPIYLNPSSGHNFGFSTESGFVASIVSSFGTRYKIAALHDLMVEIQAQYFFSDWVDGLNPNYSGNKSKDMNVLFHVGYIYYLP